MLKKNCYPPLFSPSIKPGSFSQSNGQGALIGEFGVYLLDISE